MVDCAIICDVILVLLKLQSLFFFVFSKATAPCAKMWSLSHCYRVTWRFKPSPYNLLCKGIVNVSRSYKHINFKGKQKQVMWVVQEGHQKLLRNRLFQIKCWVCRVKSILEKTGMPFIWDCNLIDTNWLGRTIGLRLNDIYAQEWLSDVNNNSQCKVYRIFKRELKLEKYLTTLPLKCRLDLCRFRCSNSRIPTVCGRYHDIDFCDRICTLCHKSKLGDEYHYLFECPIFSEERSKFLKPIFIESIILLKWMNF